MFEFEAPGTIVDLLELEGKLLKYLGYSAGRAGRHPDTDESHSGYPELTYDSLCEKYSTHELDHGHEERLLDDYGHAAFITNFPEHTDPFWNMARKDGRAQKVDVILSGIETIGSAERSIDPEQMRKNFLTISKGKYAEKLFAEFGRERVMAEMDQFMALTFVSRFGGGIGITRLIRSLRMLELSGNRLWTDGHKWGKGDYGESATHPDFVNPYDFDYIIGKLTSFFKEMGFIQVYAQNLRSIMAACEDPTTMTTFNYIGLVWPLPQTNQMHLEVFLLEMLMLQKKGQETAILERTGGMCTGGMCTSTACTPR